MSTSVLSHPGSRRLACVTFTSVAVLTLATIGASTRLIDHAGAHTPHVTSAPDPTTGRLPNTADAAERWVASSTGAATPRCRPDAADRWRIPDIAPADLPYTADAAERWLTPEIAVRDLPYTADAAERWLCAP